MKIKADGMKIAIPLNEKRKIYHNNPWTAPYFAIYAVKEFDGKLLYCQLEEFENPWLKEDEAVICDVMSCSSGCSNSIQGDLTHLAEHYVILEVVNSCTYMVVDIYCMNVEKVLKSGGIIPFEISSFIHEPKASIKKLLVEKNFIYNINDLHYVDSF